MGDATLDDMADKRDKPGRPRLDPDEQRPAFVGFNLPSALLERLDEARGKAPRSAWLREAVEEKLGREEP